MLKFILLVVLFVPMLGFSSEKVANQYFPKTKKQTGLPYYGFEPYVPMKREYAIELGSMWEKQTLYWAGGRIGFHLGTCVFSESQSCQQYWDVLGGVGGRDGYTNGLVLTGPRWQFINYPDVTSPSVALLAGAVNFSDEFRSGQEFTFGVGFGWTMAVHEDLDLRLEFRAGGGDHEWSQAYIGLGIKIDNIVTHYADKLKDIGEGTMDVGGQVIKSSVGVGEKVIEGTGKVIKKSIQTTTDVIQSPFKSNKDQ